MVNLYFAFSTFVEDEKRSDQSMIFNVFVLLADTIGLHRVENTSNSDGAVSLHLYCPPYSSCSIFNQKTGKQAIATVEFYSKYGHRDGSHKRHKVNRIVWQILLILLLFTLSIEK